MSVGSLTYLTLTLGLSVCEAQLKAHSVCLASESVFEELY